MCEYFQVYCFHLLYIRLLLDYCEQFGRIWGCINKIWGWAVSALNFLYLFRFHNPQLFAQAPAVKKNHPINCRSDTLCLPQAAATRRVSSTVVETISRPRGAVRPRESTGFTLSTHSHPRDATEMPRYASREAQDAEQAVRDAQARLEGNNFCADCGYPRPEYINLTIGTFICQLCCEVHKSMSNRRIKDIYAGDLTMDDARRMESVGNEMANRKFLATWNSREVPEPDRNDKESLREFLWLKYDGSFKKQPTPQPPSAPASSRDYRSEDRYYDDRAPVDRTRDYDRGRDFDRNRGNYRREQDLFRDSAPQQGSDRSRSYWASRYDTARPAQSAPLPPASSRPRDEYYRRGPSPGPPYPDRYRGGVAPSDRFQPPQPTPVVPYGRAIRNAKARYQEQGYPYEDYASLTSEDREDARRRVPASRSRRATSSHDSYGYSDGDADTEPQYSKSKSSKDKGRSRRRKSTLEEVEQNYYSDDEDADTEEVESSRSKKSQSRKSKKSSKEGKSKRREEEAEEENYEEDDEEYEEARDAEAHSASRKPKKASSKRSDRRSDRERDSVVTTSVDGLDVSAPQNGGQTERTEFDLMSEWMGDSKGTEASQATAPAQNAGSPNRGPIPAAMQQAYATQMPMMAPPMSVYGGMMPVPGGGFMPVIAPGFMPGMGMPGMPGMPGVPPGMSPGMPPGMPQNMPPNMQPGMMGAPVSGVTGQSVPPVQGMVNGMQHLNLNSDAAGGSSVPPPPPPPMGMPAGPAPGPPPEPPHGNFD